MNYNKKQMQPLIDKYQINPNTNKLFASIIEMFNEQPNYQIWAVKCVFSKAITFDELTMIHDWAEKNQPMIKNLEKKNIVSYSNRSAIIRLIQEMKGVDMINAIKDVVSHFNTEQRKMLLDNILSNNTITPIEASKSVTVGAWFDILSSFNRLPSSRKNNFYTKASSVHDLSELKSLITNCLEATYKWDKEDMIAYLENNAKDCDIVFDKGPYVIVHVPSYESSEKLCGRGRTQWCITMRESHFRDYVQPYDEDKNEQFFLFDFSRKETDCFAHIGFTLNKNNNIIYAQTCDNKEMLDDFTSQSGEVLNIHSALSKIGANPNSFVIARKNKEFLWSLISMLMYINKNSSNITLLFEKDNRVIIEVSSNAWLSKIINHTMINEVWLDINEHTKTFIMLDFNLPYNDANAIIAMTYSKDKYGTLSNRKMYNLCGKDITNSNYLESIGIHKDDYIKDNAIKPEVMLHKLIDEHCEDAAIKLIEKYGDKINVNYEFNMRVPIFSAANNKMFKLFKTIVNHPKFDLTIEDGLGDSILQTLLFIYSSEETTPTANDKKDIETMVSCIIEATHLNFNSKDINNDTAINISCGYPQMAWVTKALVSNKNVDINSRNDSDLSPLGTAITNKNIEAIKVLGKRPDLIVSEEEKNLAKEHKIRLSTYIKPTNSVFSENDGLKEAERLLEFAMSESL